MKALHRRNFIKASSLSFLPALLPGLPALAGNAEEEKPIPPGVEINFLGDGDGTTPTAYISRLQAINTAKPIEPDRYGAGGAVEALEKRFCEVTGKEAALFMPTGTMANQLALKVLSGDRTKVFVQETSHVYRDEADAAQAVHGKRLVPLAQGETYFTADDLKKAIDYYHTGEVFRSGMGAVSVENPVRRTGGRYVPLEEIKKIAAFCKEAGLPLHLDGARIYFASAWEGVSIKEYSAYFDTVYISLYKYLGAAAGAVLCGPKEVMDKMGHLMKIYGGSMYRNWTNAAMALHTMEGLEGRLTEARKRATQLFAALNATGQIKIEPYKEGTNIYPAQLTKGADGTKLVAALRAEGIRMNPPNTEGRFSLTVNETLLHRELASVTAAFTKALKAR
jgi:threonine aldolase